MKKSYYSLIFIISLFIIISCSTESTPVYQLNTSADPLKAGSVTPSEGEYEEGEQVEITASPNEHWVFDRWQGDHTGNANPAMISMDSDKEISAVFTKREYPLTITTEGEGSVTERVLQEKTNDYPHGTVVELTAEPAEGWNFSHWVGSENSEENPISIEVDSEREITAIFERNYYNVSFSVEGDGEIELELKSGEYKNDDSYVHGSIIELKALPSNGWNFESWDGDVESEENPLEVEILGNLDVRVIFARNEYSLSIEIAGEGEIERTLVSGTQTNNGYLYESIVELNASPSMGWEFNGWFGDINSSDPKIELEMSENIDIVAEFKEKSYLEIGTTYEANDGLTVTLNSFDIIERTGSFQYQINYTLENNTDDVIDEGSFKLFAENSSNNLSQTGFFNRLFPSDTRTRSFTFEEVKDVKFVFLAYHDDIFFANTPPSDALIWRVNY